MTYEEFIKLILEKLKVVYPDSKITINKVMKNNGIELDGVIIKEEQNNITPSIYLNSYYEEFSNGSSIEEVLDNLIKTYEENKMKSSVDVSFFYSFENIKDKIVFRLINKDANEDLLKDVPYVEYLDLAIIFIYFDSELIDDINCSIMIKNEYLKKWNIEKEVLMEYAQKNSGRILGLKISSMEETMKQILGPEKYAEVGLETNNALTPLFIISNEINNYGATCILYKDMLKALSLKLKADLYIVPSSVHELIALPASFIENDFIASLKETIHYVNENELDPKSFLSNNLYFYESAKDALCILH